MIKKLQAFAVGSGITSPVEDLQKNDLNQLLCSFVIQAKKYNCENYVVTSMKSLFSMLGGYVKSIDKGNVDQDVEYRGFCDVKKAKVKVLKSEGKGNRPFHATHLTPAEEDMFYSTDQFGWETPEALQRTMWWHATLSYGHRGRQESRQMQWGDIQLKADANGHEYIEFRERLTKSRSGGAAADRRSFAPKAFENKENPARCPVETYKRFASHRPENMMKEDSPFYLAINYRRSGEDTVWYTNGPLGKNTISQFLKEDCRKAGVPGRKTNHSARKTCVKRALDAGYPREYVAPLTGHKSVNSLENYAQADVQQVQQVQFSSTSYV